MWATLKAFIVGKPQDVRLPDRVREAIDRQQVESEHLISCVQFLLLVIFASLWAVSPPPLNKTAIQPVPLALLAYFGFTVVRLFLTRRGSAPGWFLSLSVVMDMALLMTLIWSFHIQYMQPPSFYLKAPTVMYVFIFIALRALRFEPRYIILAGLSAAVGWGLLMVYVITANPFDNMVTRDFVKYITSNAILVGAEIDKILSILLVTAVLAIAVHRARKLLHRAILDSTAAEDLSRFVSKEVAERIVGADRAIQPGDGEAKMATVMFTDIEGFSTVSEGMSPRELATTLNEYFGAMGEVIDRQGGVITLFEGDLMLITFNALRDDEDHAASALRTAYAIQTVANGRTFGPKHVTLKTRCGINTGEIVIGAVGAKDRLVFTVHGDNVNIAARLEQLNKQHGSYVMLSEATEQAVAGRFATARTTEVTVRGRAAPTVVYVMDCDVPLADAEATSIPASTD